MKTYSVPALAIDWLASHGFDDLSALANAASARPTWWSIAQEVQASEPAATRPPRSAVGTPLASSRVENEPLSTRRKHLRMSPRESAPRAPLRFLGSKRVLSRLVAGAARRLLAVPGPQ